MKTIVFILFMTLIYTMSFSQNIKGSVTDSKTGNPLAFVNIIYDNSSYGVSSDIDGRFEIDKIKGIDSLSFIYVGYKKTTIATDNISSNYLNVQLTPKSYTLSTVSIISKENPAHRIIKNCSNHRKENNPENLKSFSYNAYHKMIFTAKSSAAYQPDSVMGSKNIISISAANNNSQKQKDNATADSSDKKLENFLKSQHLFVMESISKHTYKKPDKHYEKVIGTKMSGLQDPLFVMLANQFQSFSFYKNNISLLDKKYVNPISNGSTKKYFFLIEDTLLNKNDTIFIISFRPLKGKNFDGMKGLLYINTNKYAIQNVIAQPADTSTSLNIKIQQKYELVNGAWFPVQLNTNLEFRSIDLNGEPLVGIGKSYLKDIKINEDVKNTRFSNVVLDIDKSASKQNENFWQQNRALKLDSLELKTYHVIDSLGKAEHFDRKLWTLRTLANGSIPIGIFDLQLNKIVNYNEFEGLRAGLGFQSNNKLSDWFNIEAYGAWGIRDKQWKYGGALNIDAWRKHDMKLSLSYNNDVEESAKQFNFSRMSLINENIYRNVLIKEMVYIKNYSANLKFRAITNLSWKLGANYQQINSPTNYQYVLQNDRDKYVSKGDFNIFEAHLGIRFAYKEKIIRNRLYQISMGTKFPILNINYTKGIQGVGLSELNYKKLDLQLDFTYNIRYLGQSYWRIAAGKASGELPWYKLYNGKGSYIPFFVESPYSFSTMRVNEFISDEYFAVYFRHDFKDLLFGNKKFIPQPVLVSSFTIGDLHNANKHKNINYNTLEKGYYESGIMFNSILKSNISQIGVGIMYRYGPYSFKKIKENFTYKLTLGFNI